MVRGGSRPSCNIRPALHGGVTRHSRFSEFLSCENVGVGGGLKNARTTSLTTFVFPSSSASSFSESLQAASPQVLAALAQAAAALGGQDAALAGIAAPDISMACIPFIAPGWTNDDDTRAQASDPDGLSVRARNLQRGLAATCFIQAGIATLEFALNDGISGLIGCAIATMGLQASSPSGYRFLPSYIVLAFCNGTMQVLVSSELAAHAHILASNPHGAAKLAACVALASPSIMFVGIAVAWHLHCELRALALQALPAGMRSGLAMPPPVDGVVGGPPVAGSIGQGAAVAQAGGPFRPFIGQPHRLEKTEAM